MWPEFVVGSRHPCFEGFIPSPQVFYPPQKLETGLRQEGKKFRVKDVYKKAKKKGFQSMRQTLPKIEMLSSLQLQIHRQLFLSFQVSSFSLLQVTLVYLTIHVF